jgi:hypothetical protein
MDVLVAKKFPSNSGHSALTNPFLAKDGQRGCSIYPLLPWYHLTQIAVFATETFFQGFYIHLFRHFI